MIRVIIVEDEVLVAHFMSEVLKKMGCDVVEVIHKFDHAVEIIRRTQPDILLLDINLGTPETKKAGIAIAKALKDENISTIFMTAYSDNAIIKEAIMQNPENYVVKPFTEESLGIPLKLAIHKIQSRAAKMKLFPLCQDYIFDATSKCVICHETKIFLTSMELCALDLLCNRSNKIVTYEELQQYVWAFKPISNSTMRELFSRLRKKIPCLKIQNHSGIGYQLNLEE